MLRDDPNESSAVYLLSSDDKYAVCGTNFLPNQLLCRKYLATKFFFVEETFDHVPGNEKDQVSPICRYRTNLGDFRHRRTMILKVYINGHKTGENRGKELNNVWMNFSPTCRQKPERQCRTTIYCQRNSIFHGQKNNYNIHLFDRPKSGFVRAKKYLAGHHDRRPAVRYFEPCNIVLQLVLETIYT